MRDYILVYINGKRHTIQGPNAWKSLAHFLRHDLQLTGTKIVCNEGDCGACTVLVGTPPHHTEGVQADTREEDAPRDYRPINACIAPLMLVDGCSIVTVEGLATRDAQNGLELSPVQEALAHHHGSQCGFCTPGFVCTITALFEEDRTIGVQDVKNACTGNLCRCTGYEALIDGALHVDRSRIQKIKERYHQKSMLDDFARSAKIPLTVSDGQRTFYKPTQLDEVLRILRDFPETKIFAGATDLGVLANKTRLQWTRGLCLAAVSESTAISKHADSLELGPLITLHDFAHTIRETLPELHRYLHLFASPQIKNSATLVGNIANASPIGDLIPPLLALDARLRVISDENPTGREIPLCDFYHGYKKVDLRPEELIWRVIIPRPTAESLQYFRVYKVSKRKDLDISTVSAAFRLEVEDSRIQSARMALGGVAPYPLRVFEGEKKLVGLTLKEAAEVLDPRFLQQEIKPLSDLRGSAAYRMDLVERLIQRFWRDLRDHSPHCEEEVLSTVQQADSQENSGHFGKSSLSHPIRVSSSASVSASPCHDSALSHVTGTSMYLEDLPAVRGEVYVGIVTSPVACGELVALDFQDAASVAGFVASFTARDIVHNSWGPIVQDQPVLASSELHYKGEPLALVAADSPEAALEAVRRVRVEVRAKEPLLSIEGARAAESFFLPTPLVIKTGDLETGFAAAEHILEGTFTSKGQDHFYLESQSCIAYPGEMGDLLIHASTQHPSEVQHQVAHILGLPLNKVVCTVKRMGGGFGGKESQATHYAALCALVAQRLGRVARLHLTKDDDMAWTGKRHAFVSEYKVGFQRSGQIVALKARLLSDGGAYLDLSQPVLQRALLHVDNAYFIPHFRVEGQICRTHQPPNTAFRGFGGPQGVALIESIIEDLAFYLQKDPLQVRLANLYGGDGRTTTPYGQEVTHNTLPQLFAQIIDGSDYHGRQQEIAQFNTHNSDVIRSLSITPVKFGISFTVKHLNQGNALVNVQRDGTVQVSTGATEMGQGVQIKIAKIVAEVFGLPATSIKIMPTSTEKNHNTSATAASSGSDINGFAALNAATAIKTRLAAFACYLFQNHPVPDPSTMSEDFHLEPWVQRTELLSLVRFAEGQVFFGPSSTRSMDFASLVDKAYFHRISLGEYGFYKTPGIYFDREKGSGHPFLYYTNGVAASEVQIDRWTGEVKVLRTDILMDLGRPLHQGIDRGQVAGAFIQGLGWVCIEDLRVGADGTVLTHSPTTYKIPNIHDIPRDFRISFLDSPDVTVNVRGSKAVGEPPLLLALSVWTAVKHGLQKFAKRPVALPIPATAEKILPYILGKTPYAAP